MSHARRTAVAILTGGLTVGAWAVAGWSVHAQQGKGQAINDRPNPYQTIEGFFKLPAGREWGATSAVDIDKDGKTTWVAERCGGNSCANAPTVDPVLHFDENGKLMGSFGKGLLLFPHGIFVDRDGNIWVTDGQDNAPTAARGGDTATNSTGGATRGRAGRGAGRGGRAAAGAGGTVGSGTGTGAAGGPPAATGADGTTGGGRAARGAGRAGGRGGRGAAQTADATSEAPAAPVPFGPRPGATKGHQVIKFSPTGQVLLTIGKAGGAAPPECCYQPNDVITSANGDIFISEGHNNGTGLIFKFDKTGKLIKMIGKPGSGPGEFSIPHSLAFDSRGRLFVADRGNVRIQILDQEGKFLEEWYQFSRLSGIFIDKNDMLYGADSESSPTTNPGGWIRGMRIGTIKDGKVLYFIPDPAYNPNVPATGTSAAEGVAVDAKGNIYGAEVGPRKVVKYVRK